MQIELSGIHSPLVSIIVPSFNQGRFIRRTLESILSQDYRPIEVWVIDGASTDETLDVLREFQSEPSIHILSEPDRGVVDAVNKGLSRATGIYAAIQSSDDFYLPGAVSAAVSTLNADSDLAFVYGDVSQVDVEGTELSRTALAPYSLAAVLTMRSWIPQPSTFFRLALAKSLGGWRESVPYAADTDLWLRMAMRHPARKIDRLMAERSLHDAQRDKRGNRIVRDYTAMIDSLPGLDLAPPSVRRAAEASKALIKLRYDQNQSEWQRVSRLWSATLNCPEVRSEYPVYAYLPRGPALRASISRLARCVGLR